MSRVNCTPDQIQASSIFKSNFYRENCVAATSCITAETYCIIPSVFVTNRDRFQLISMHMELPLIERERERERGRLSFIVGCSSIRDSRGERESESLIKPEPLISSMTWNAITYSCFFPDDETTV